jgi:predicted 3-demethylubiquinone-9 3-methyltransferase (glyoxalase superfamily)
VPEAEQCGWVKDRFGVSWQIVPRQLVRLIGDVDRARAKRAFDAMMQMKRTTSLRSSAPPTALAHRPKSPNPR